MTAGEVDAINSKIRDRLGSELSLENIDQLATVCPAQMPAFYRYFPRA